MNTEYNVVVSVTYPVRQISGISNDLWLSREMEWSLNFTAWTNYPNNRETRNIQPVRSSLWTSPSVPNRNAGIQSYSVTKTFPRNLYDINHTCTYLFWEAWSKQLYMWIHGISRCYYNGLVWATIAWCSQQISWKLVN